MRLCMQDMLLLAPSVVLSLMPSSHQSMCKQALLVFNARPWFKLFRPSLLLLSMPDAKLQSVGFAIMPNNIKPSLAIDWA